MKVSADAVAGLARTILASGYADPKPTPDFHYELWRLCCSDYQKVAIAAPRGSAKSTIITWAYVIACLVFRERKYVLILSKTEEQSAEFIGEIKRQFQENDDLIQTFGVKKVTKDTQTDIIVSFNDNKQCRVIGKGAEQEIRGRKWRGTRPDLIIGDDMEGDEQVLNEDRRDKFRKWFRGSVLPIGSDNAIFRVVGTILHFDSLLERLMPKENDPKTIFGDLCYHNYQMKGGWASIKYKAHPGYNDFTKLLWPEKHNEASLRLIQEDYEEDGVPDVYAREYLNEPIAEGQSFFRKEDFLPLSEDDKRMNVTYYAAGDLAISKRDRSAYTSFTVVGLDSEGRLQFRDQRRGRWDSLEIIEEIFSIHDAYKPQIFWLEDENIRKSIGPVLEHEMRSKGLFVNIETVTPSKDKRTRARPLQARMKAKACLFDKEAEWYFEFEKELRRFDKGQYMDQVDSAGLIAFGIDQLIEPSTDEEIEDEEYEEEFGGYYVGRDMLIGY